MKTGDFLDLFIKKGGRSVGGKVVGWKHDTFIKLAELTSYLIFNCDFDEKGLCKARRPHMIADDDVAQMCCCSGCKACMGFHYILPADYGIIETYASHFDKETGFWRKGHGCILPRKYRSSTCLTYNCDHNSCRPDSHKYLLLCLRGKRDDIVVDGKKSTEYYIAADLRKWLRKKNKGKGSPDLKK